MLKRTPDTPEPASMRDRAIRSEIVKRHSDYELTWVDKMLGLTADQAAEKPWFYHAWMYPTAKLGPAIGQGAKEFGQGVVSMFQTAETDMDPVTGRQRERSGADLMLWQLEQSVRKDLDHYLGGGKAKGRDLLKNYQDMLGYFGPDSPATQEAGRRWSAHYREWEQNSVYMATLNDLMSKYGSKEALADTLYNRPDKILVDIADIWSPQIPAGILAKLRRATPGNVNQIIDEIMDYAATPQNSLAIGESETIKEASHLKAVEYLEELHDAYDFEPLLSHEDVFDEVGDMILDEDIYERKWHDKREGEYDEEAWELEEVYWDRYEELVGIEAEIPDELIQFLEHIKQK